VSEHDENETYICPECGAEFDSRTALRKHIYDSHIDEDDLIMTDIHTQGRVSHG